MRITPNIIFDQLAGSLGRTLEDYYALNNALASGKRIAAPSDDVTAMMRALDYRVSINGYEQYQRNIDEAENSLNVADTVLTSLNSTLADVKQLAVSTQSGTSDPATQTIFAEQAVQLRDQLYSLANSTYLNRYLFAGFISGTQPYAAGTYAYQGDAGVMNVPIDSDAMVPMNVVGSDALSYTLAAAESQQISGGRYVHYTPGAGTTIDVEIRDTDDTTVLDTFSFSNIIQMTDQLSSAISTNNALRIEALVNPFGKAQEQLRAAQSDVGARLSWLSDQSAALTRNTNALKNVLSSTEDADMLQTIAELKKTEVSLQALREASSRILSQSLFDFLR